MAARSWRSWPRGEHRVGAPDATGAQADGATPVPN